MKKSTTASYRSKGLKRFLDAWPGKERLGMYRFLPIFFVAGAVMEFTMVKWRVGEVNFYSVFREKEANRQALKNLVDKDFSDN